ncbi:MAG: hypothetical protein IJC63_06635 [Myxococcaceae bacterium]|nr:hypothetical protein [Myxococcaceae bacterium]
MIAVDSALRAPTCLTKLWRGVLLTSTGDIWAANIAFPNQSRLMIPKKATFPSSQKDKN